MNDRIFLVDDEQPVLDGLSVIISKHLPELTLWEQPVQGMKL
jgi:hypothetical protein